MSKFVVAPHFRLQEWVAEEKGYFAAEGLDYEFRETMDSSSGSGHHIGNKVGAYQTLEAGRTCDVSGACHWTVNVAASNGHGKLYADCYSVSPCGVFVPPESPVKTPADLAGVPISVGYQSGSHYATIQGLEQYLKPDQINLSFNDGLLFSRMELLIDRKVPAASLFSGPYYFARAARLPQDHRHHLHDGVDGHRHAGPGGCAQVFPRAAPRAARHRPAAGALHALLQEGISGALPRPDGYAALGSGRAAGVRAVFERRRSRNPSSGSSSTAFSRAARWAAAKYESSIFA